VGAEQFMVIGEGADASEAFAKARDDALYEYGHSGYTGTIAEKPGFVTLEAEALNGAADDMIHAYVSAAMSGRSLLPDDGMERLSAAVDDKWGPAGHIPLSGNRHLFFGWASS
jgi:hypothetical protein